MTGALATAGPLHHMSRHPPPCEDNGSHMNISFTNARARVLTGATVAAFLASTSAHALEGKALFDALIGKAKDVSVTYDSVEESGPASFTLKGVTWNNADGSVTKAPEMVFEEFREDGETFSFARVFAPTFTTVAKNGAVTEGAGLESTGGSAPAALLEGDLEGAKNGRMKLGSLSVGNLKTDNDQDGTFESSLGGMVLKDADVPLDWRYTPEQISAASGPAAAPLTIDSFAITDIAFTDPNNGVTFELGNFSFGGVNLPTTLEAEPLDWAKVYDDISIDGLKAARGDKPFLSWDTLTATVTEASESVVNSTSELKNLFLDLEQAPNADPQQIQALKDLGYAQLRVDARGDGSYDVQSGRVAIDNLTLDVADLAELSMSYVMTGYTPEVARTINQLSAAQSAGQGPDLGKMFEVLSNLKLESMNVALKDDSGTRKILDYFAAQQGTTGDQVANMAPIMISAAMRQIQAPEFTKEVSDAVATYLKNPGTLKVSVNPEAAPTFSQIVQSALQSPKFVIDLLDVKVEATN